MYEDILYLAEEFSWLGTVTYARQDLTVEYSETESDICVS